MSLVTSKKSDSGRRISSSHGPRGGWSLNSFRHELGQRTVSDCPGRSAAQRTFKLAGSSAFDVCMTQCGRDSLPVAEMLPINAGNSQASRYASHCSTRKAWRALDPPFMPLYCRSHMRTRSFVIFTVTASESHFGFGYRFCLSAVIGCVLLA